MTIALVEFSEAEIEIRAVRDTVFGDEQNVPQEINWDGNDEECLHVLARGRRGKVVATGRLAPDGKIYCMPVGLPDVLVVDPVTRTLSTFSVANDQVSLLGRRSMCIQPGVLAADGLIYSVATFLQRQAYEMGIVHVSTVLVIDPINRT